MITAAACTRDEVNLANFDHFRVVDREVVPAATLGRRRAETRLVRAVDIDDVQMPWAAGDLVIRIDGAECAKLENIEPRIRTALETSGDRGAMGCRRVFLALGSSARMLDGVWPYGQETQPALLDVPGVTGVGAFGPAGGGVKRPVAPAAAERQSAGGASGPLDATI